MAAERIVGLVPRVYPLLVEAVEAGAAYGWRRAWKYLDGEPDEQISAQVRDRIAQEVIGEILERFAMVEPDREED